jgi:hypothetical protein
MARDSTVETIRATAVWHELKKTAHERAAIILALRALRLA